EAFVLDAQREARESELRTDAVSQIRAVLGVVVEQRGVAIRFPARDADAAEEIDERQRVEADRGDGQRSRIERCGRGTPADGRRARCRADGVRLAEVDIVDLEPEGVERPDPADQLEPAAVVIDAVSRRSEAE